MNNDIRLVDETDQKNGLHQLTGGTPQSSTMKVDKSEQRIGEIQENSQDFNTNQ